MNFRAEQFVAVLLTVLMVIGSGPAVAYQSAQASDTDTPLTDFEMDSVYSSIVSTLQSSLDAASPPENDDGKRSGNGNEGANSTGGDKENDKNNGNNEGKGKEADQPDTQGNGKDAGNPDTPGKRNQSGGRQCGVSGNEMNRSAGGPPTCKPGGLTVESGDIQLDANASALAHRNAAVTLIKEANATGPGNSGQAFDRKRQRALAQLNGTYQYHLDENRVLNASMFETDHRAIASLHRDLPNATRHLATADRKLAGQAIDDAGTVRAELDARNVSYDERAVDENISEAKHAYRQGQRLPAQARHARIQHYRQAWTHAQRAIDIMDEAVAPNVTIARERNLSRGDLAEDPFVADLPRNNSTTLQVTGTVLEIRGYELTATFTVNNTTRNLTLASGTAPLSTVTFNRTVELDRQWPAFENGTATADASLRTYTVNVTVRDPGLDLADQGYDEGDQLDVHYPQIGGDELYFDGDGLPGWYEQRVTGTDPLDPDSDVPATDTDEAGNGDIDGIEDPDNETLVNYKELLAGTNPLDSDTDQDNLTDAFELRWRYDPLTPDTDGDGVADGEEDPDEDDLINTREQELQTHPRSNDSDRDGLVDGREVNDLGTDPKRVDTDDDRLRDLEELELPTDPLNPDTDDDGVPDGNETFTTTTENKSLGVEVAVTGPGNAAAGVEIFPDARANFDSENLRSVSASDILFIHNATVVKSAKLTISYGDVPTTESDLAVYRYDQESQRFRKLPSTVHPDNDTITAESTELGPVVVMATSAREDLIPDEEDRSNATVERDSFELDLDDCSGFCDSDDGGITVGVTSAGKGTYPGADSTSSLSTANLSSVGGLEAEETRTTDSRKPPREKQQSSSDGNITDEISVHAPEAQVNRTVTNTSVIFTIEGLTATSSGDETNKTVSTQDYIRPGPGDGTDEFLLTSFDTAGAGTVKLEYDTELEASDNGSLAEIFAEGAYGSETLGSVSCSKSQDCPITKNVSGTESVGSLVDDKLRVMARTKGSHSIEQNEDLRVEIVYDHDGDGVPDPDDLCASTEGTGENGCPDSTYQAATLTFDQPVDTVQISAAGTGYVETSTSSVELFVEDDSGQPYSLYGQSGKTGTDGESYDKQKTISDVGTELTLVLSAEGTAALHLDSLSIKVDTDGDGLWNTNESHGWWSDKHQEVIKTDPYSQDTDGDGLADDEEIAYTDGVYIHLNSRPDSPHSDRDGIDDGTEVNVWGTDPAKRDTDGDGMDDLVDEEPTTYNGPPNVRITSPDLVIEENEFGDIVYRIASSADSPFDPGFIESDYYEHFRLTIAAHSEIESVEVNAKYDPVSGAPFWKTNYGEVPAWGGLGLSTYNSDIFLYQHGLLDEPPELYWINVTTANGNGYNAKINLPDTGLPDDPRSKMIVGASVTPIIAGVGYAANGFATGSSVAGLSLTTAALPAAAVTGGVLALGHSAAYHVENTPITQYDQSNLIATEQGQVPTTEYAKTYGSGQTVEELGLPVRLPNGAVYEAPAEFPNANDRGFGKEHILKLPGATEGNVEGGIGEVLRLPGTEVVEEDGPYTIVIGDNPFGAGQLQIKLLDVHDSSIIISASHSVRDTTRGVHIDITDDVLDKIANRRNNWDHNQVGTNKQQVLNNVREIIDSPDEIWEDPNQNRWMYVKKMSLNGQELIVTLIVQNGEVRTAFVPTHPDYQGATGYSDNYAQWYIKSQDMIKQYTPGDTIVPGVNRGQQPGSSGPRPDPTS